MANKGNILALKPNFFRIQKDSGTGWTLFSPRDMQIPVTVHFSDVIPPHGCINVNICIMVALLETDHGGHWTQLWHLPGKCKHFAY